MSPFDRLSKIHVLAAIRDHGGQADERLDGAEADVMIVERGRQYDARAIVLAAYEKVTGERVTVDQLPQDLAGLLTRLELKVVRRSEIRAAEESRRPKARVSGTRRSAAPARAPKVRPPEPQLALCPRCMMQLPAGRSSCDYCD
ncbi:hypothetical protein [Nocardioides sp.]|uniref:hypothetical protein n=1 Tax=Nocardioides sp. TaxID=35761 RepID=UPI0039E3E4C2